jgi:hypothetical protein
MVTSDINFKFLGETKFCPRLANNMPRRKQPFRAYKLSQVLPKTKKPFRFWQNGFRVCLEFNYGLAGAGDGLGIGAGVGAGAAVPSSALRDEIVSILLSPDCVFIAVAARQRTTNADASVQVAFSRKSVVLRTPITWLLDAKVEDNPPPFEF